MVGVNDSENDTTDYDEETALWIEEIVKTTKEVLKQANDLN